MNLFYTSSFNENTAWVTEDEARHLHKVFRYKEGDDVLLTDGKGWRLECIVDEISGKKIQCSIHQKTFIPKTRSYEIEIGIAPTKNINRIEWLIEKGVELGLDKVVFLSCMHSERRKLRMDRLQRIAWAALKQSKQYHLPQLVDLTPFDQYVAATEEGTQHYIAHLSPDSKSFRSLASANGKVRFCIGPEGDFSKEEMALALQHNWVPCTFGNTRLRTETAALAAISFTAFLNEK